MHRHKKPTDLKTSIKLKFQELSPAELTLLSNQLSLKKGVHKFVKIMHTNPQDASVDFLYEIKTKANPAPSALINIVDEQESMNVAPRVAADPSKPPQLVEVGAEELNKPDFCTQQACQTSGLLMQQPARSRSIDSHSDKYSSGSSISICRAKTSSKSASQKIPNCKAKAVSKQVNHKKKQVSAPPSPNVFKQLSATKDEHEPQTSGSKTILTAAFNEVPDAISSIKISDSGAKRINCEMDAVEEHEQMPDSDILAKVRRTVELLSELHHVSPSIVVDLWIDLKHLDQVKIHLAQTSSSVIIN